jgi:thiol-disulfide isomerase/thioredoxin
MRNVLLILIVAAAVSGCKTGKPAIGRQTPGPQPETQSPYAKFSEQSTWLLGYLSPSQFSQPPHSEWYIKGYDEYQPEQKAITNLQTIKVDDLSITVVMGTWCPDSRREVPRFMRILDLWQFPPGKVTFIGVDNTKLAPVGDFDRLEIERVPTFIILKNNVEAGRIIENPETSLEQDIINILTRSEK